MTHVNFTTSGVALTDTQVARIREEIENTRFRSAWDNGVKLYALDILGDYSKMLDYAKETLTHSIRHEKQHRKRDLYSRRHTQAFHPDNSLH